MTTDLLPMYRRLRDENSEENFLPVTSPWWNTPQIIYPPKNEFDVEINDSNNRTNIELAERFQRIQAIQAGKETLLASINTNPGTPNWDMDVRGEERGFFRRQPKLMSIKIRGSK